MDLIRKEYYCIIMVAVWCLVLYGAYKSHAAAKDEQEQMLYRAILVVAGLSLLWKLCCIWKWYNGTDVTNVGYPDPDADADAVEV